MIKADVLVIGSGISGLSYAIKVSEKMPEAQITIVTKADEDESNTKYAQGGLAVVTDFDKDNFQKHIDDTTTYVEAEDTRVKIDIVKLNAEIKEIVAREQVLRDEIDKIIAEIEV